MIKLFNNLQTIQPVRIRDRSGKHYTTFIESRKSTEIEGYQITDDILKRIKDGSLVEVGSSILKSPTAIYEKVEVVESTEVVSEEIVEEKETLKEEILEEDITSEAEVSEESEDSSSVHVCEICGNEFASKRGLEMHKSRSHK